MLVVQLLLPRFLVVEVLFFIHFIQTSESCSPKLETLVQTVKKESPSVCLVPVGNGTIKEEPLFYDLQGEYLLPKKNPDGKFVSIKGKAFIFCPKAKLSSIGNGQKNVMEIQCASNQKFRGDSQDFDYKDLSCSRSIQESVEETVISCGPREGKGKVVHIGWQLPGFSFKPQITICHDRQLAHSYYSSHILRGANIEARSTGSNRPTFREGSFFLGVSANDAYKRTNQREKILSKCHNCSFVARGHLSPRADFIYEEWQDATFYYINAVPQQQRFNSGNWAAMEASVRNLASSLNRNLFIQTGTFGQVLLKDNEKLALGPNDEQIPVPLYLWKLVYDGQSEKAIVFVILNHYAVPKTLSLCSKDSENLCEENGWRFEDRRLISKGLLFCCKYQSIKAKIPWMQNYHNVKGILKND